MLLRHMQWQMAIKIARGYRTISHEAAVVLAGVVPFDLQAEAESKGTTSARNLMRASAGSRRSDKCY